MRDLLESHILRLLMASALAIQFTYAYAETPPFDYEKSGQLSPETRREYDVVFFNEIAVWNTSSNRYGSGLHEPYTGRSAEFKRMARDGYLPAYVALRLLDIQRGVELNDPGALAMLIKAADAGDASSMCTLVWMPINRSLLPYEESSALGRRMEERGLAQKHPACMASRGVEYLFGQVQGIPQDTKAAMPLLLYSAKQGYYVAVRPLFNLRFNKALSHQFDFANLSELKRGLCWGRLAQQYTNSAGFDSFLRLLGEYAKANDRADLVELGLPYDPRRVPITQTVVKPEDCIQLELGE